MSKSHIWRTLADAEATAKLGALIATKLRSGEAICLYGSLGAGKSTLARALIRTLTSPEEEAPSPTFTLVQTYEGPDFMIAHFDLYRLKSAAEAYEIGLEEALETGAAVIEWPERLEGDLPAARLDVHLAMPTDVGSTVATSTRLVRLTGHGAWIAHMHEFESGWPFDADD